MIFIYYLFISVVGMKHFIIFISSQRNGNTSAAEGVLRSRICVVKVSGGEGGTLIERYAQKRTSESLVYIDR